jgi:hypothetical protein
VDLMLLHCNFTCLPITLTSASPYGNLIVHRWTDFWKLLWAKGSDHFRTEFIEEREIQCDGDTVTFRVMRIHDAFNLDLGGLLIRDEWDITYAHAKGAFESGMNNFIVIGQPGIGANHVSVFLFKTINGIH